jgi:NADH dehydrogenase
MHVFLTGATGFVGAYILRELLAQGHTARCLLRDPKAALAIGDQTVDRVKGDVTQPKSFAGTMRGCDAVIHLVGIIDEQPSKGITFEAIHQRGARHVVDEAVDAGVERFVLMSANGAREDGVSRYQTTKWKAEGSVKQAGFAHWCILRPSLIFGAPGAGQPEFCTRLVQQLIKPFPVLPIFGDGQYKMQPVSVEAVAAAFVQALALKAAHGQTYCVAGQEAYPYTEILDRITRGFGKEPKPKLPSPLWLVRPAVQTLGAWGLLPISPDQFEMLLEGNTCDPTAFYRDFDVTYKPFTPENLSYLKQAAG